MEELNIGRTLLAILIAVGTVATFTAPDAKSFMNPELARMVFWHLPNAITSTLFLLATTWFSLRYLQTKQEHWDVRATAAQEIALVTGILTLATGILFSKYQWGNWWDWDPRQTSFLFVMMFVGAYFALRAAFDDPTKRASNSAAYSVATILPLLFLIFVFPRLPSVANTSLHPDVVRKGGFDVSYKTVFYSMFVLIGMLCVVLYRLRVRAGLMELALEESYAELASRDDSAATRMVRPVSLSEPDRQEGPRSGG
ncbi:MAG TPA: cytochrome c biogenesis protein CcsA [Fimbriimonas sp.]